MYDLKKLREYLLDMGFIHGFIYEDYSDENPKNWPDAYTKAFMISEDYDSNGDNYRFGDSVGCGIGEVIQKFELTMIAPNCRSEMIHVVSDALMSYNDGKGSKIKLSKASSIAHKVLAKILGDKPSKTLNMARINFEIKFIPDGCNKCLD